MKKLVTLLILASWEANPFSYQFNIRKYEEK